MKKIFLLGSIFFLLLSCSQRVAVKQEDLKKMNGYWEIKKVLLKDGSKKEYKVNETVDFIQISNNKGFRQKVMPQLNGKFLTNGIKETMIVSSEDNHFLINYISQFGKFEEELLEITDSTLVTQAHNGNEYYYKKFTPFSLK